MADFLETLGQGLQRFGAGFEDPTLATRMAEKRASAQVAAAQLALQSMKPDDPRRASLEAVVDKRLGAGFGAAFSKAPVEQKPESFTLGRGQTRFEVGPSGTAEPIATGTPFPEPGAAESTAALKTRAQKISDQMRLNSLSEAQATDVVDGNKVVSRPDAFGNLYLINRASGDRELIAGPGTQGPGTQAPQTQVRQQRPGMSPEQAAREGTGPVAATIQGVSNLFGFMFSGQIAPRTVEARQTLGLFNKTMQRALINNPKFPVAEQNFVRGLMPDTATFFKNPNDAVANVKKIESYIDQQISIKTQELNAPGLTTKRKAELSDQISALREMSAMFPGSSANLGKFSDMTVDELMSVDTGSFSQEDANAFEAALDRALQ